MSISGQNWARKLDTLWLDPCVRVCVRWMDGSIGIDKRGFALGVQILNDNNKDRWPDQLDPAEPDWTLTTERKCRLGFLSSLIRASCSSQILDFIFFLQKKFWSTVFALYSFFSSVSLEIDIFSRYSRMSSRRLFLSIFIQSDHWQSWSDL